MPNLAGTGAMFDSTVVTETQGAVRDSIAKLRLHPDAQQFGTNHTVHHQTGDCL
jgi:hypothetical protein